MEKIVQSYLLELDILRRFVRELVARFPKISLGLAFRDGVSEDPHVERVTQAIALLNARIALCLDDGYPLLVEAMLEATCPHYLQSFPSCAIAHVADADKDGADIKAITTVPRGTVMKAGMVRNVQCIFKSAYDVVLAPLTITDVKFDPHFVAPGSMRMPAGVSASIKATLQVSSVEHNFSTLKLPRLRVFIDAEPAFSAAIRDAIFLRAAGAFIEVDGVSSWTALDAIPIDPVGFAEEDALIPFPARSHPAYRLLTEYYAFPEKFNFFDLDLAQIGAALPGQCRRFTLHLALAGVPADSHIARVLAPLASKHLALGCTPVVNLFARAGNPLDVTHTRADYTLLVDPQHAYGYEIHSVDSANVRKESADGSSTTQFRPIYSLRHGESPRDKCHYWITRRDPMIAASSPGHEMKISFVDSDFNPMAPETTTLSTMLTCSNRDLPCALGVGAPDGDLAAGGVLANVPIRFLRQPSRPHRFEAGHSAHWRLISHLSLNYRSLCDAELADFQKMLALHDLPRSSTSQRQIDGIVALEHKAVMSWVEALPHAYLLPGIEIRMTLDEQAFVGSGISMFAQVMDRFLALYGQINVSTLLIILSKQTGKELMRCQARSPFSKNQA